MALTPEARRHNLELFPLAKAARTPPAKPRDEQGEPVTRGGWERPRRHVRPRRGGLAVGNAWRLSKYAKENSGGRR